MTYSDEEINQILSDNCKDIFLLKVRIDESRINPNILFYFLNTLESLVKDTGYGNIHTEVVDGEVKSMFGEHRIKINLKALQ